MLEAKLSDEQVAALIKEIPTIIVSPHYSVITPIMYVSPEQYDRLEKLGIIPLYTEPKEMK